jgi:ATP-dependent protease Clp ATPase subunit
VHTYGRQRLDVPLFFAGPRERRTDDTMFDLPSLEGVEEVVISKQVVDGTAPPLYIYADRTDRTGDASA